MKQLSIRVWEYSLKNPDGFTLNIENFKTAKYGIVVAYLETQDCFEFDGLLKCLEHSLRNEKLIGGWINEDGKLQFDSVRIFKNSELHKAIEFAKANRQRAIFDLTNIREIKIEY